MLALLAVGGFTFFFIGEIASDARPAATSIAWPRISPSA